ncbi:hypothetical protein [Shewanella sp. S1-49-MNA-CIBAN-0167]|uniref:hypothetical protein n=1 Tax=unclassified Shewanella TaxID=196818 RepID=UPI0033292799
MQQETSELSNKLTEQEVVKKTAKDQLAATPVDDATRDTVCELKTGEEPKVV